MDKKRRCQFFFLFVTVVFLVTFWGQSRAAMAETSDPFSLPHALSPDPIYRMTTHRSDEKIVYLTFDDGPSPMTEQLLDLLDKYQAKATFFMLQPSILKYPQSVRRMRDEGFALGLHGVSHNFRKLYRSKKSVIQEMTTAQKALQQVAQVQARFIRTPYGSSPFMKLKYRKAIVDQGFIMWDWNIDSQDWRLQNWRFNTRTIQKVQQLEKQKETPVILLHDMPTTVRAIEPLLKYLHDRHYEMRAITPSMHPLQFRLR